MGKSNFIERLNAVLVENETGEISAEDLKTLLINGFDDQVEDAVKEAELASYIKKPVLSIVEILPEPDVTQLGNRYYIESGENSNKIAEWKGTAWQYQSTKEGDCIFSFQEQKLIVRTKEGYEVASNRDSYEVTFNVTESVRVNHNLNRYPSVVVMDSSNRQIITEVTYLDRNTCEVSWTGETSGKIVCN